MYADLIQLIQQSRVAFPKHGQGVPQATIDAAERTLGFPLPSSYKWWLLHYGGGQIGGDIVYGLDIDGEGRPDIVELAQQNAEQGLDVPHRLVCYIGNEESFAFNTERLSADGEYEVLLHDHDADEGS